MSLTPSTAWPLNVADSLDLRGLSSPWGVLKVRRRLLDLAPGQALEVWASDASLAQLLPPVLAQAGHRLVAFRLAEGCHRLLVQRGPDPGPSEKG